MQTELDDVTRRAYGFLAQFFEPMSPAERMALHQRLMPTTSDYDRVFVAGAAAQARDAYAPLWRGMQPFILGPKDAVLRVFAAYARDFASENPHSREFPAGYAQLAELLQPEVIWVGFRVTTAGESNGTSFDGLVLIDDRFVMFPKAFRYVRKPDVDAVSEAWSK